MTASLAQTKSGILLQPPEWTRPSSSSSSTSSTPPKATAFTPPTPRPTAPRSSPPVANPSSRKIRFAPLPDPRRSVLVDENGEEVPIPNGEEATHITAPPALAPVDSVALDTSSLSSFGSSKRNSDTDPSNTPGTTTPASTPSEYGNSRPGSPSPSPMSLPPPLPKVQSIPVTQRPKSKGLSFFKPFKRSSGSSSSSNCTLTPTSSIDRTANGNAGRKGISTEEILTLGTINLFRTTSKESLKSNDSSSGWSLTRWTSTNSGHPPVKQWGAPLSRSQSSQSYRSKTPSLLSGLRPSSAGGRPKTQGAPIRKGTRMLNGRVYGGRRLNPNSNLFANAPDADPEFVEWGYGGMGSVKGARSAGANSKWALLHGSAQDEDLDDGGGMAWVKKRKEAREQKEREEKEAKAKAERQAAGDDAGATDSKTDAHEESTDETQDTTSSDATPCIPVISESAIPTPRATTPDGSITPNPLAKASSASINTHHSASTAIPTTPTIPATTPSSIDDAHIFTTMAVPMHRSHRRSRSRDGVSSPTVADAEATNPYFDVEVLDKRSSSGSSSEVESETDEEEDDEDDDDDEDEEEEERRKAQAMVIGAGMEKISRHRIEHDEHP